MKLRGIDFGNVWGASGVQGFFGEGYWFHRLPFIGADFEGMTFTSETATLYSNQGNMPLTANYEPKEFFPPCIKVKPFKKLALNAKGLSNPGLIVLLGKNKWQQRTEPFVVSITSLARTPAGRLDECKAIREIFEVYKEDFCSRFCLQPNLSCPNTKHDPEELIDESADTLEVLSDLEFPQVPKYSIASAPIKAIMKLNNNPHCDGICVSNTLPFGWEGVDWQKVWGSKKSPLAKLGGGGLSGKALCPLVCEWIMRLRDAGFTKPINGGGGILSCQDVDQYYRAGASSVFLGSIAFLRPRRVQRVIRYANSLTWR